MTSKIVTMTVVIAPTMVMKTFAVAEIIALIPDPMAENIDPMVGMMQ